MDPSLSSLSDVAEILKMLPFPCADVACKRGEVGSSQRRSDSGFAGPEIGVAVKRVRGASVYCRLSRLRCVVDKEEEKGCDKCRLSGFVTWSRLALVVTSLDLGQHGTSRFTSASNLCRFLSMIIMVC